MNRILVTGAAGFIGYHLCQKLLNKGEIVIGIDNLNSYYAVSLKKARLNELDKIYRDNSSWNFLKCSIENEEELKNIFNKYKPEIVVHLAAQAGVRYSLVNPNSYVNSNLVGFNNIIECSRKNNIRNMLYSSSSSVYGGNLKVPFSETDSVNHPVSLYAATKKANELVAHAYSHLYNMPCTGMRFFTVYGPWGRPDMAPMIFANSIFKKEPIKIFNHGLMKRDFTYIDDVIDCIVGLIYKPSSPDLEFSKLNPNPASSWAPHKIFNIGNSNPIDLMYFIEILEKEIGIKSIKEFHSMQKGDVESTFADTERIKSWINFSPNTNINQGIKKFISWYKNFYY